MTDWPWEYLYYQGRVRLRLTEDEFWSMTPRTLLILIDEDRKTRTEDVILSAYAQRIKDPAMLRDSGKASPVSEDAAWDALG